MAASKRKQSDDEGSSGEEFKVAHIVDKRTRRGKIQFRVIWEGFLERTWEPEKNVQDTCALDRYLKFCEFRKAPSTASVRIHDRRGASTEEEGELELSRREVPIAQSKYCVAKAGEFGLGVFALDRIPAGTFLWMYAGGRMRTGNRDGDELIRYIDQQGGDISYCYLCQGGVTIDGSQGGNDSRFVNHYEGE